MNSYGIQGHSIFRKWVPSFFWKIEVLFSESIWNSAYFSTIFFIWSTKFVLKSKLEVLLHLATDLPHVFLDYNSSNLTPLKYFQAKFVQPKVSILFPQTHMLSKLRISPAGPYGTLWNLLFQNFVCNLTATAWGVFWFDNLFLFFCLSKISSSFLVTQKIFLWKGFISHYFTHAVELNLMAEIYHRLMEMWSSLEKTEMYKKIC